MKSGSRCDFAGRLGVVVVWQLLPHLDLIEARDRCHHVLLADFFPLVFGAADCWSLRLPLLSLNALATWPPTSEIALSTKLQGNIRELGNQIYSFIPTPLFLTAPKIEPFSLPNLV